ncbi:hypothetical protein ACWCZ5_34285 [Streptomyces sp. NPDC001667]
MSADTYRLSAPAAPGTVRIAREFLRAILAATHEPSLIDAARICVSDAVTSVLPHMSGTVTVDVAARPDRLIVDVGANGRRAHRDVSTAKTPDQRFGLLRKLSYRSGVTWTYDGSHRPVYKSVWFELRAPRAVAE